jgi:drug/metabolite transporter (DMT)-like permease
MLLTTVVLWALNLTASRYVLTHGFQPLAYSTLRYATAAAIFLALTFAVERTLRAGRSDLWLVFGAAALLFVNQIGFVYALDRTTASTVGLILGATPIFAAVIAVALGLDRLSRRLWIATVVSFAGVGLVAAVRMLNTMPSTSPETSPPAPAATWAGYSVVVTPLQQRYSAYRVSALVLAVTTLALAIAGGGQTATQELSLSWEVWSLFWFAVLGPLVITTVLWYRTLDRIGAARATLAANLHPFVAAVFAVVLLSERITLLQVAGGVLIAAGILVARARRRPLAPGAE